MKFLFGLIALFAAVVLILSILRPGSKNNWGRIVVSLVLLVAGIVGYRYYAEESALVTPALIEEVQSDAANAWNSTRETGDQITDAALFPSDQALKNLEESGGMALNATKDASDSASTSIEHTIDSAASTASELYDDAKETINEFGAAASETADDARQAVDEVITDLENATEETSKEMNTNSTKSTNSTK